ncbi:MAG TPA: hypothetical protein VFF73_40910 [Planctomycetota bacterium]|nr:hypothetical protein [Planctomycetota bacterium]
MAKEEDEDTSALARVRTAAKSAVVKAFDPQKAKHALAFKLIAGGLALTALAAGFDYFSHDDDIHKVVAGFARQADLDSVARGVESWDETVDGLKSASLKTLPPALRDHLAGAALAGGLVTLVLGVRLKIKLVQPVHGHVLRDVGRAISGPGVVGIVVYALLSWRGVIFIKRAVENMAHKVSAGELSRADALDLVGHYGSWPYNDVAGILWTGIVLGVLAIGAKISESRLDTWRIPVEVARRTASWASALSLLYYLLAVIVAVVSYGGGLTVLTWPWKLDPAAFIAALSFMSFGMGLDRTGTRMIKREEKDEKQKKK